MKKICLHIIFSGAEHFYILKNGIYTVGRKPDNDIEIPDSTVSSHHLHLTLSDSEIIIEDLGSKNGTYISDKKIEVPSAIKPPHEFFIGMRLVRLIEIEETELLSARLVSPGHYVISNSQVSKENILANRKSNADNSSPEFSEDDMIVSSFDIKKHLTLNNLDVDKLLASTESARANSYDKLSILYDLSSKLNSVITDETQLLDISLKYIKQGLGFDRGYILMLNDSGILECKSSISDGCEIIISKTIAKKTMDNQIGIITADAGSDSRFNSSASIANFKITSAMCAPIWIEKKSKGIIYIDNSISSKQFTNEDLKFLTAFANQISLCLEKIELINNLKKELTVKSRLQRYLSAEVIDEIISNPKMTELGGERKSVSVLFADIRNFTVLSQETEVDLLVNMINDFFSEIVKFIFEFNGTIDKFLGDAIMAVFGAPVNYRDNELRAVNAAVKIQKKITELRENWIKKFGKKFHIGIGISSGEVIAGNVGSTERMDYTIMGHAVNLAARICSITPADEIFLCEKTASALSPELSALLEKSDPVELKGIKEKCEIFKIRV